MCNSGQFLGLVGLVGSLLFVFFSGYWDKTTWERKKDGWAVFINTRGCLHIYPSIHLP